MISISQKNIVLPSVHCKENSVFLVIVHILKNTYVKSIFMITGTIGITENIMNENN